MRSFRVAFQNIPRSPYQALTAILNLTLICFIIGILVCIALGAQLILVHFETRPQVIAYLADQASNDDITSLTHRLQTVEGVDRIKYVSKEEALSIYKE